MHAHPQIGYLLRNADLAVIQLADERLRIVPNRIEHLANFEIAIPDVDILDVLPHQLVEGAHVPDRIGDGERPRLIDVSNLLKQADQLAWGLFAALQAELLQHVDGLIEVLLRISAAFSSRRLADGLRLNSLAGHGIPSNIVLKMLALLRRRLFDARESVW
jgi:hypothetical protein